MVAKSLDAVFYPQSIAVVGASKDPYKAAHQILNGLIREQFTGKLFPVNPKEKELLGLDCHPSLEAIPERVDLIVVGVPAQHVPEVMRQAARRGDVKAAIILSAGFAETAVPELVALQDEVVEIAQQAGIRVVGPNCVGVMNTENRLTTHFTAGLTMTTGNIGIFSQSGAMSGALVLMAGAQPKPMGISKLAHVGNMSDVSNLEILSYYEEDASVKVIVAYMEGVRDGRELLRLAERITRKKPVLLLKVGRTEIGSKAALSHTGTLAGSDKIYDAAFAQSGILRMDTMDELMDAAKAISLAPLPKGNRIAILTEAGGPGIIAMDEIGASKEATLAPISPATREALEKVLPPMAMVCKPDGYVDMTAAAMVKEHGEALRLALEDPNVDGVIIMSLPPTFLPADEVAQEIADVAKRYDKPVFACFMKGGPMEPARRLMEEQGVPTFDTPDRTARAMINLMKAAARMRTPAPDAARKEAAAWAKVHPLVDGAASAGANLLEHEAMQLLQESGVKTLPVRFARNREEAVATAEAIGFPVVLKIVSPQIIHKSEYGGVKLNLRDREAVAAAYDQLMAQVGAKAPDAELLGVIVTPFVTSGTEVIVGLVRDPQFGPVVMFGLGGVFVEVFKDVSFRVAPFERTEALRMIAETKAHTILQGVRGEASKDLEALADLLVAVGEIGVANPQIAEMDLNPVKVLERGLAILDARVIVKGKKP